MPSVEQGLAGLGLNFFGNLPTIGGQFVEKGAQFLVDNQNRNLALDQQRVDDKNADLMREFAKMGIRWRVEDAKAAGLHPLAALGMQPAQGSPVYSLPPYSPGMDVSRAARAGMTHGERLSSVMEMLTLQRAGLENELIASQIARMRGDGPPVPEYNPQPHDPIIGSSHDKSLDPGAINSITYARMPGGKVMVTPSKDIKERLEDNATMETMWEVLIRTGKVPQPPRDMLPPGAVQWGDFNRVTMTFSPLYPEPTSSRGLSDFVDRLQDFGSQFKKNLRHFR